MEAHLTQRLIRPSIFQAFPHLVAAQSTRHGGSSQAPYSSLNLSLYTNDNPKDTIANRKVFFGDLGFDLKQVATGYQIHGSQILMVSKPGEYQGYDAFISNKEDLLLGVSIADCTPILIYDPVQKVVAAIHAGWKGTVAQIVYKTLKKMHFHFSTLPMHCYAYIGACIDECDFEVDADVADYFSADLKRWDEEKKKFFVDLKQANFQQLIKEGLDPKNIEISPLSTVTHNAHFFSHRKEKGTTGRMLAVIGMKKA